MSDATAVPPFHIQLSADRSTATLVVEAGTTVSAAEVIAALKEMKLTSFDDGNVIEALEKRKTEALSLVVCAGTPAVDEISERLSFCVPVADGESCTVSKVESGKIVATVTPAVPGTDGRDVFGQPIVPRKAEPSFQLGRNLKLLKTEISATAKGNLRLNGKTLSAEPLLELRGDSGNAAPVNFDGDAVIKGSLTGHSNLQISGSLIVGGAIESVQLTTGGSVHVAGGIIDNHQGKLLIGGGLRCRFISGSSIMAACDVHVQSEVIHSRLSIAGKLTVAHGPIYGGLVAANGGISCQMLGHLNGTATIVEAGDSITCRSLFLTTKLQIDANRKRVSTVRSKIEPLLRQIKHLTPQQREKATELMYEAEELEIATHRMEAELEAKTKIFHATECAEINVTDVAHAGVTVRFHGVETLLATALKGPFKLMPRKTSHKTEILLIDQTDQSTTLLPSHPIGPVDKAKAA